MSWIQIGEVYDAIPAAACMTCGAVVVRHELPAECSFCKLLAQVDALAKAPPAIPAPPPKVGRPAKNGKPTDFGTEVRTARKELAMNQAALAGEVGCSVTTLSRIETGQVDPTPSMRAFLCEFLGIDDGNDAETVIAARGR